MTQRDHRHRGQALLREPASTSAASGARSSRTCSTRTRRQGGSTIAQQFVKNALQAQQQRTIFQKLREAALAYHLTRKWSKEQDPHRVPQLDLLRQRRLRDRVGGAHVLRRRRRPDGCGAPGLPTARRSSRRPRRRCSPASSPRPRPTTRSINPVAAKARRDLVLREHARSGLRSRARRTTQSRQRGASAQATIQPPREDSPAPYFTTWVASSSSTASAPSGGVRGRPADPDHARPRPAAGGPAARSTRCCRSQSARPPRSWRSTTAPARCARWSAGAGDYAPAAVQPRHPGAAPAGVGVQALRARRGAASRASARTRSGRPSKKVVRVPAAASSLHGQQLQQRLLRLTHARRRDRRLRQLGVRRGRHQGRHEQGRRHGAAGWASARRSRPTPR